MEGIHAVLRPQGPVRLRAVQRSPVTFSIAALKLQENCQLIVHF